MAPRKVILMIGLLAGGFMAMPPIEAQIATTGLCSSPNAIAFVNWHMCWQLDEARAQGLELTGVHYQGRLAFWRMGVPFSITNYSDAPPGPFKDTLGRPAAGGHPGYGNGALIIAPDACPRFLAVGVLINGGKICQEMGAGSDARGAVWSKFDLFNYRFIQGWIFHADGTVEPKLLLGGLLIDFFTCESAGGSTCETHFHHVYWRFDIDIDGPANDRPQEFSRKAVATTNQNALAPPVCPGGATDSWCTVSPEAGRVRNMTNHTKWRVVDVGSTNVKGHPRSIEMWSNSNGAADAVSTSDVWFFQNAGDSTEIGYEVPTDPASDAGIQAYANGTSLDPGDVVLWYAEKIFHEPRDEETPSMMYHEAGPKLRVRNFLDSNNVEQSFSWPFG